MANRKDIRSGSVFAIPLEKGFGFAYAKIIFGRDLNPKVNDMLLLKVYDLHSNHEIIPFNKDFFESDKLLFFPLLPFGLPPLRGNKKWVLLGHSELTFEDKIFPDFLDPNGVDGNKIDLENDAQSKYGISYRRNFKNKRIYSKQVEHVKHLGYGIHRTPRAIVALLTMHFARNSGKTLRDIYTNEELKNNFWLEINWKMLLNTLGDINSKPPIERLRAIDNSSS